MTSRDLLRRLLYIWHWSALATIASFYAPILLTLIIVPPGAHFIVGMHPLNESHFADPFRWMEWLLLTAPVYCLASAAVAIATGVTYLIGRNLPDFSDLVSRH
jgi:hypothetical protein